VLIDVNDGRKALAKLAAKGYRVLFTISGFVPARQHRRDNGVRIEFEGEVTTAQFGKPELASVEDEFREGGLLEQ